ncbi:hypothetical protein SAMN05428939_6942 [Streptomyces sp. TLI_105]|nr:hypothetical protein SAMN05428939_6942 [Streptomyces sp. TLI_105]
MPVLKSTDDDARLVVSFPPQHAAEESSPTGQLPPDEDDGLGHPRTGLERHVVRAEPDRLRPAAGHAPRPHRGRHPWSGLAGGIAPRAGRADERRCTTPSACPAAVRCETVDSARTSKGHGLREPGESPSPSRCLPACSRAAPGPTREQRPPGRQRPPERHPPPGRFPSTSIRTAESTRPVSARRTSKRPPALRWLRQPPEGWDNPTQRGTMTLKSETEAVFTDDSRMSPQRLAVRRRPWAATEGGVAVRRSPSSGARSRGASVGSIEPPRPFGA